MDFTCVIKQKTTDELLMMHSRYYDYQKEFILQLEQELRDRGASFDAIDFEEFERQKAIWLEQKKEQRKQETKRELRRGFLRIVEEILGFFIS